MEEVEGFIIPILDKYSIRVSSVGSSIGKLSILEVSNERKFQQHLYQAEHIAKIAKLLGAPYIRFFSFIIPIGQSHEDYRNEIIQRVKRIIQVFEDNDVIGLHENEQYFYGDTPERCMDLIESVNSKNCFALFDFANFVHAGRDTVDAYSIMKKYVRDFHIKDAKKGSSDCVVCGTGDAKIQEVLQMAADDGYGGFLTLEPHLVPFNLIQELKLCSDEEEENSDNPIYSGRRLFTLHYNGLKRILQTIS